MRALSPAPPVLLPRAAASPGAAAQRLARWALSAFDALNGTRVARAGELRAADYRALRRIVDT